MKRLVRWLNSIVVEHQPGAAIRRLLDLRRVIILGDQVLLPAVAEHPDGAGFGDQAIVCRPAILTHRRVDSRNLVQEFREEYRGGVLFMGQGAKWQQVNERADRNLGPWVMLAGGSCAVILFLVFSISRQRQ